MFSIEILYYSAIPPPQYVERMKTHVDTKTCAQMFRAAFYNNQIVETAQMSIN